MVTLLAVYLGVGLSAFAVFSTRFFQHTHLDNFDATLFNLANDFIERMRNSPDGAITSLDWIDSVLHRSLPFGKSRLVWIVTDPAGEVLRHSNGIQFATLTQSTGWKQLSRAEYRSASSIEIWQNAEAAAEPYRLLRTSYFQSPGDKRVFVLGAPLTMLEHWSHQILLVAGLAIPMAVIGAAMAGRFFTRQALEPLREIVGTARMISPSALSDRVPVPATDDELRDLAVTLNSMLTRIENAFRIQDRFVADASHQLKTPVAVLKNELSSLRASPDAEALALFLESAEQEIEQLETIVGDLLLMAQIESGTAKWPEPSAFHLDELVADTLRQLEGLAREAQVHLRAGVEYRNADEPSDSPDEDPFVLEGQSNLLQGAIQNLVTNAIKFSEPGGNVLITMVADQSELRLDVKDEGMGVPEGQEENIFARFYRASDASGRPGTGLGLSIARRIVEMHGGKLFLLRQPRPSQGACFRAVFPRMKLI